MKTLILVAGLPGSGKSRYAVRLSGKTGLPVFDDLITTRGPRPAARILRGQLSLGMRGAIVPDHQLCLGHVREEFVRFLSLSQSFADAPSICPCRFHWRFFADVPQFCLLNIARSTPRHQLRDRLLRLTDVMHRYTIPPGTRTLPICTQYRIA